MGPAVVLAFSVLTVSGTGLETADLLGRCIFMLKGKSGESPRSQGHPWLGPSLSDGGKGLWVMLKQTKLLRKTVLIKDSRGGKSLNQLFLITLFLC